MTNYRFVSLMILGLLNSINSNSQVVNFFSDVVNALEYGGCDRLHSLITSVSDPDVKDDFGDTYIHALAEYSNKCCAGEIEILINKGATANLLDNKGESALDIALKHYNNAAIIVLIDHGWTINNCKNNARICAAVKSKDKKTIRKIGRAYRFFSNYSSDFAGIQLGAHYNGETYFQASVYSAFSNISMIPVSRIGFSLGSDFTIKRTGTPIFGPRFSLDYRLLFFVGRSSFIYYTRGNNSTPCLSIDGGISLFSLAEVALGTSFIAGENYFALPKYHLSIVLQIPFLEIDALTYFRYNELFGQKHREQVLRW